MVNKKESVSLGLALPKLSKHSQSILGNSFTILENAIYSSESFLSAFQELRRGSKGGAPTDHQQDLLRASLIFSCAGVDALIKQLIRDSLPKVIDVCDGAKAQLSDHVKKSLLNKEKPDLELISKALLASEPISFFKQKLCDELTSFSLQSAEQILSAGSYFDIKSTEIIKDFEKVKAAFKIRNEISHEMDVDLTGRNRKRRPRKFDDMRANSKLILEVGINFLNSVSNRLK